MSGGFEHPGAAKTQDTYRDDVKNKQNDWVIKLPKLSSLQRHNMTI